MAQVEVHMKGVFGDGSRRGKQNLRLMGIGVSCRESRDMWQVPRYLQALQELGTKQDRAAKLMGVLMRSQVK